MFTPDPEGRGELPYKKDRGAHQKFWKEPQEVPKSCPVGVAWNVSHPWAVSILNNTLQYLLSYFFQLNPLKGTAKATTVDVKRLNILNRTKTAFNLQKVPVQQAPAKFAAPMFVIRNEGLL